MNWHSPLSEGVVAILAHRKAAKAAGWVPPPKEERRIPDFLMRDESGTLVFRSLLDSNWRPIRIDNDGFCPTCDEDVANRQSAEFKNGRWINIDSGEFWFTVRQCPFCGTFLWENPVQEPEPEDPFAAAWRGMLQEIGFAIDLHERWIRKPWLTKPICACHPDIYVKPS